MLATACEDGKVRLWDARTWKMTGQSADYGDPVYCVEFSPNGQHIAYCGGYVFWGNSLDTSVRIWDLATNGTRRLEGHTELVYAVAWSPKGDLLASAGIDGQVKLWDPVSGRELPVLEVSGGPKAAASVAFSPDGRFVAVGGVELLTLASWAQVFNLQTRRPVRELSGHSGGVMTIAFSRDGQWIATGSYDGTAKLWPVEPIPPSVSLEGHDQVVCAVACSSNGRQVATGSFDQTARIWDADTGLLTQTIPVCFPVVSLALSPDGNHLLTPGADNTACIWQVQTGRQLLALRGHTRAVMAVAWSPDSRSVATGGKDGTARIWHAQTGTERLTLAGHTGWVRALAFSPDGKLLATGSADRTIRLWQAVSGRCLRVLTGHTGAVLCLAFSPDGQRLASGSADLTARIWETDTGRELVAPLQGGLLGVTGVAFSADGQRLATAAGGVNFHANIDRDCHIRLWDVQSGHQLLSLITQTSLVLALAFGPDGRRLITAGVDNKAAILTAFPWLLADYPGDSQAPLAARIEDYKRQLWRSAASANPTNSLGLRGKRPARRLVRHGVGEFSLPLPGIKIQPLRPIVPRPAQASSNQLDLTHCYNVALDESWQPADSVDQLDQNLAALPSGCQTLAGVPFDVRGLVQLRRAAADFELFPERTVIPVQRAFQRLHCLHGTREPAEEGTLIAAWVLHYADGTSEELPVCYGVHVRQVAIPSQPEPDSAQGEVVWKGPAPAAGDWQPRLYKSTFVNPKPSLEVLKIEYVFQTDPFRAVAGGPDPGMKGTQ